MSYVLTHHIFTFRMRFSLVPGCSKPVPFPECPRSANEIRHCGVICRRGFLILWDRRYLFYTRQCQFHESSLCTHRRFVTRAHSFQIANEMLLSFAYRSAFLKLVTHQLSPIYRRGTANDRSTKSLTWRAAHLDIIRLRVGQSIEHDLCSFTSRFAITSRATFPDCPFESESLKT